MSVLPESPIEPIVLTGQPPDPTRIPSGCRFHPRCPELASGAAAAADVAERCTGVALPVLPAAGPGDGQVACHLAGPGCKHWANPAAHQRHWSQAAARSSRYSVALRRHVNWADGPSQATTTQLPRSQVTTAPRERRC